MSKSALYVANTSTQVVAVDGIINPGTVIRRFGPNIGVVGNAIQIAGAGYYAIQASITLAPTAEGDVTISLYKDGVPVQGALSGVSAAAAGDIHALSISAIVREFCACCDGLSNFTLVLSGVESNVTNVAITIEKL